MHAWRVENPRPPSLPFPQVSSVHIPSPLPLHHLLLALALLLVLLDRVPDTPHDGPRRALLRRDKRLGPLVLAPGDDLRLLGRAARLVALLLLARLEEVLA